MAQSSEAKSARLLYLYSRLVNGQILSKNELAQQFHVTQRSIQRDMESLRCFFADQHLEQSVVYDAVAGGYRLTQSVPTVFLSNSEILAVCKILLESRSLLKTEMEPILDKLIACCVPAESRRAVLALMANGEAPLRRAASRKANPGQPVGAGAGSAEAAGDGNRVSEAQGRRNR